MTSLALSPPQLCSLRQDLAVSMRGAAAGVLCVAALVALAWAQLCAAATGEEHVLAESDFLWDVDGWTTSGAAEGFQHGQRMIKASDKGAETWHFVAPAKFLGAKRAAYGGKLSFRHGFFEYNRCAPAVCARPKREAAPPATRAAPLPR